MASPAALTGVLLFAALSTADAAPRQSPPPRTPDPALANENRTPAGRLHDGVLTLRLEVRAATWHPDGDDLPGLPALAFAEPGAAPQVPGRRPTRRCACPPARSVTRASGWTRRAPTTTGVRSPTRR